MRSTHGLRALEMGVGGNQIMFKQFRLRYHRALEIAEQRFDAPDRIDRPKTGGGGDLIIPAPAGVQARRRFAGLLMEEAIDHRVNVFVGGARWCAGSETRGDTVEATSHARHIIRGQDAGLTEGEGPRLGESDVVGPQAKLHADGAIDGIKRGVGAFGKTASPQLVRLGVFAAAHVEAGAGVRIGVLGRGMVS